MKKALGRLGAVAATVGLAAAGLVGTASFAHAEDMRYTCMQERVLKETATDSELEALIAKVTADSKILCSAWKNHFAEKSPYGKYWNVTGYGFADPSEDPLGAPKNECEVSQKDGGDDFDFGACIDELLTSASEDNASEPVQIIPPPPPCWDASINNCPVGGALRFAAPKYAMVGVPLTMYAYASWRPDANSPAQPTNGTAVIRVDGEDYSGVEFVDGVAEWRFIPETEGMKEFTASGVLFSGLSGANAYIDTVEARTYVLEYDPAAYAKALKKKAVEVGDTYVITDPNQARSYLKDRYEWSVSEKSDDVCAVYETKKGAVKAKFTDSGKCTVIWLDKESEESGKYTFIAKK
jgi:hypothetical protein